MKIVEKTYLLKEKERLDVLEIIDEIENEPTYYSYDYKLKNKDDWQIRVRWDNLQNQPHVDSYDENENLIDSSPSRKKEVKEVLKLIDIFGKNLVNMNVAEL